MPKRQSVPDMMTIARVARETRAANLASLQDDVDTAKAQVDAAQATLDQALTALLEARQTYGFCLSTLFAFERGTL